MTTRHLVAALVMTSILMMFAAPFAGATTHVDAATPVARKVLLIAAPRLTWQEVQRLRPPNLMRLFGRGSLAMTSVWANGESTTPGEAYLTIGAGNRMASTHDHDGEVLGVDETIGGETAATRYRRSTGRFPSQPIVALDLGPIQRLNRGQTYGAIAGTLGESLAAHRRPMAVIGNADHRPDEPEHRQVGLAAMDHRGEIRLGEVGPDLLVADTGAPFGWRLDENAVVAAFSRTWHRSDTVLVELSDLERADEARPEGVVEGSDSGFDDALARSDRLVARLLRQVDFSKDLVMVVAPTAPGRDPALTVFAAVGVGMSPGWARSASTRRNGYIELTDLAATVLRAHRVAVPDSANDTPVVSGGRDSASLDDRIETMVNDSRRAQVRDRAFEPIAVLFVVLLVIDLVLAIVCRTGRAGLAPLVRGIALVVMWSLPVSFLTGVLPTQHFDTAAMLAVVYLPALILAAVTSRLRRIHHTLAPFAAMATLWAVLAIDVCTGAHLQIDTPYGYSPLTAGRFAGYGNQAFSMLALSSLMVASSFLERVRAPTPASDPTRPAPHSAIVTVGVFFALTLLLDGYPSLGSDVGGVLAFLPAAAVALLMFRRIRVRAGLLALIALISVGAISVFAAIDLTRPPESRTHLGRFVSTLFQGDAGEVLTRKLHTNLEVFSNRWTWFIPVAMVYFAYRTWRPNTTFVRLRVAHPEFVAFQVAVVILAVLAMLLNDSGISMPAMMSGMVVVWLSHMAADLDASDAVANGGHTPTNRRAGVHMSSDA